VRLQERAPLVRAVPGSVVSRRIGSRGG
jgi:hypothetical protein